MRLLGQRGTRKLTRPKAQPKEKAVEGEGSIQMGKPRNLLSQATVLITKYRLSSQLLT